MNKTSPVGSCVVCGRVPHMLCVSYSATWLVRSVKLHFLRTRK